MYFLGGNSIKLYYNINTNEKYLFSKFCCRCEWNYNLLLNIFFCDYTNANICYMQNLQVPIPTIILSSSVDSLYYL